MDYLRLKYLYTKHAFNELDDNEFEEFIQAMQIVDEGTLESLFNECEIGAVQSNFDEENLYYSINNRINEIEHTSNSQQKLNTRRPIRFVYQIAAAVALFTLFTYLLFVYKRTDYATYEKTSVLTTRDSIRLSSANIEFSDGRSLEIDDLPYDTISHNGISIHKLEDHVLSIKSNSSTNHFDEEHFHRFSAKAGTTLKLILPDQSVVQLNSGSSINLATSYGVQNRKVLLQGEGFFEVAPNKNLPFIVDVKGMSVNVLGTVFNISGYQQDSHVKTTLLEGSISINTKSEHMLLKPGQQARINPQSTITLVQSVDLGKELAWREGMFRFKNESINDIMNELSKWYLIKDVDIEEGIKEKFTGSIKRTRQLKDVLTALEKVSNLKFEITEGRVRVMK